MIVCHCNVLCNARIRCAVEGALETLPATEVTPAVVYERCKCAPDCGGCRFAIAGIIDDVIAETTMPAAEGELSSAAGTAFGEPQPRLTAA
jgi:bacterioferritin-associated ferredoxin